MQIHYSFTEYVLFSNLNWIEVVLPSSLLAYANYSESNTIKNQ